jgi:hypothetical protein
MQHDTNVDTRRQLGVFERRAIPYLPFVIPGRLQKMFERIPGGLEVRETRLPKEAEYRIRVTPNSRNIVVHGLNGRLGFIKIRKLSQRISLVYHSPAMWIPRRNPSLAKKHTQNLTWTPLRPAQNRLSYSAVGVMEPIRVTATSKLDLVLQRGPEEMITAKPAPRT